jgi:hypothetical protein
MLLNQLVEINQQGFVARAVSFGLMDDVEKNKKLCQGFVFNHDNDTNRVKETTVGILDAIRYSFYSQSKPNVHLIVQEYGKGKSHFALTVANFFKLPHEREEVQGILKQLKYATSENNATLEALTAYKQRGRHLVICLSAEDVTDMRKHFFQVLNKELEANGVTGAIAQQICLEPLQFLQKLDNTERIKAEDYLRDNLSTSLSDLEKRLAENDFQAIPKVKQVCVYIKGINPDFSSNIQVKEIIDDLISKLCKVENAPFQGILILFDELYEYLQKWTIDPAGAGGKFLQNITNACQEHKDKIALVCLTQRKPSGVRPTKNGEDYKQLVSRIEITSSTYNPKASLELVLDGLLNQIKSTSDWQNFWAKWESDLKRKSEAVFGKHAEDYYKALNWRHEDFYKHLAIGCFPLHPLTSYLLCNLSFAQGRSVIDFIQKEVKDFINSQTIEKNGQLNFIYPTALVDAFESNFTNPEANIEFIVVFSDYKSCLNKLEKSSDVDPDEIAVLKALLLFYTSGSKLKKSDKEKHEEILQTLTGLSPIRIVEALKKLCKDRELIYLNLGDNTYKFYSGGKGIDELRQRVKEEAKQKNILIATVEEHCNENLAIYAKAITTPQQFIDAKRLRSEDWFFQNKVYTIASFRSLLLKKQPFKTDVQSGLVAYVIGETSEDISLLEKDIKKLIEQHPYRDQFAVAIAERPVEELAQLLLEQKAANKFSSQEFGAAINQLKEQYVRQIKNETTDIFKSFSYHSHIIEDIPPNDRKNISIVISEILERAYSHIPPIEGSDKLYLRSTVAPRAVSFIVKRILEDDLRPQLLDTGHKKIVDDVFAKSWGLLRLSNHQYKVSVPTQPDVRKAWDELSKMTNLGDLHEKTIQLTQIWEILSSPPYGYNAYTFTILLVGWMAYHRNEIFIEGVFGIPLKKSEQLRVRIEPLKSWGSTNIFDKPKDFISDWILKNKPKLIRRKPSIVPIVPETLDYDLAKQLCEEIPNYINNSPTPEKLQNLKEQSQCLERACTKIEQIFEPANKVETLMDTLLISEWSDVEVFIDLHSELQNPLNSVIENGIIVSFTDEQRRRYDKAVQDTREKIGNAIEIEGERHSNLSTEEGCGIHKANLTRAVNQLSQVEILPSHFIKSLEIALAATDKVLNQIINEKKTKECVSQIQRLYATLSDIATQKDYIRIQEEIENFALNIPSVKDQEIYREIIESINERQDTLIQQVANWEASYIVSMPREQANALKEKINRQRDRYTNENSKNRLKELLQLLDNIILERQSEESEEKALQNLLSNARGKLNDIKTIKNPIESMQAYLQLCEISLARTTNATKLEELQDIKAEGFTELTQKLSQVVDHCKRNLEQPKDYQLKNAALIKLQSLAANSDQLLSIRAELANASAELEIQNTMLQSRLEDEQTMQGIRQHSPVRADTYRKCEDAISEIESAKQRLNHSDKFSEEIDKQVQAFRDKVTKYENILQSLQDQLLLVENLKQLTNLRDQYNQVIHIFQDSSKFPVYQPLREQIHILETDIDVIAQLEKFCEQSSSLLACDDAIAQIDHASPHLLASARFSVKLQQLKEALLLRKQSYLAKLTEFQDGLSNATTSKEARQVRKLVGEAASFYQNSEEAPRYESICSEAELLVRLLQIFEDQKTDTPEDCAAEINKLSEWQEKNPETTSMLRLRLETKLEELTTKQQDLQTSQRKSAKSWFESIQRKRTAIEQIEDQSEKISESNRLLKRISKERLQYEQLLESEQKQFLEETNDFLKEIQSSDREAKILDLFQELPKTKRESVLKRLAEFLEHSGEES